MSWGKCPGGTRPGGFCLVTYIYIYIYIYSYELHANSKGQSFGLHPLQ